ncbi:MAG: hypothetical protein ABL919_08575 [Methylococcales bacterium]|nr:hypothetical protein [Methylococcaceae bacterium]
MSAQNDPAKNAPLGVNLPPINDEAKRYLVALTWSFRQARESFEMMTVFTIPSPKSAAVMVEDAEKLLESAKKMLVAITPKEVETGFNAKPPRRISLDDLLDQMQQERGIEPLPLEQELLLKRVADGGHSGQFLADAFLSAYRKNAFNHSLFELINLDAEGFRLFHQVIHIRHVPGWNDDSLYQIEKQINAINKGNN